MITGYSHPSPVLYSDTLNIRHQLVRRVKYPCALRDTYIRDVDEYSENGPDISEEIMDCISEICF